MTHTTDPGVEQDPAPLRLALGSDTYSQIMKTLTVRLGQLDAQRELALSTDFADHANSPRWFQPDDGHARVAPTH